jgi:hypothetical protein
VYIFSIQNFHSIRLFKCVLLGLFLSMAHASPSLQLKFTIFIRHIHVPLPWSLFIILTTISISHRIHLWIFVSHMYIIWTFLWIHLGFSPCKDSNVRIFFFLYTCDNLFCMRFNKWKLMKNFVRISFVLFEVCASIRDVIYAKFLF